MYGSLGDFTKEAEEKWVTERVEGENEVVFCLCSSSCVLKVTVTTIYLWGVRIKGGGMAFT